MLLVLGAIVSVQVGGAVAATLVPEIGAAGSVLLRLGISAALLLLVARPVLRRRPAGAWATVLGFGLAMGAMNWSFYASLARLPLGVAVTVEFLGPLTLAAVQSHRPRDLVSIAAAAAGVALMSQAWSTSWAQLDLAGLGLALLAGGFWAAYIVFSQRTGRTFERLDGLALAVVVSLAVILPFGLPSVGQWDAAILAKGAAVAVLSSVLPYSLELLALRSLSQRAFGILLSLEPAVAAGAGLLVLRQRLAVPQLLGMALVVLASAFVLGHRRADPAQAAAA